MKTRHFSIRFTVGSAIVSMIILTALLMGLFTFYFIKNLVLSDTKKRLENAVAFSAHEVDPDLHSMIRSRRDESGPAYQEIKRILKKIQSNFPDSRLISTFRMNDEGNLYFVVDVDEIEEFLDHVGTVVQEPNDSMLSAFKVPFKTYMDNDFVHDDRGVWLTGCAPIHKKNQTETPEGILCMDIPSSAISAMIHHYFLVIIGAFAIFGVVGIILASLLSKAITRSLVRLEYEMAQIQDFNLEESQLFESRIVEIERMKMALENMRNGLVSFKKYVPSDLVRKLIKLRKEAVLEAEKKQITVMFMDIENFTTISEKLNADTLAWIMGEFFKGMTERIMSNSGIVDKYIGDAIMAIWGAPDDNESHAVLACRAAIDCRKFIEIFSREIELSGFPAMNIRVGINSGEAVVGNFGYEKRLSYTAIGKNINLASRLEGLNRIYGTRIIIGEETNKAVRDSFITRPIDVVVVKGGISGNTIYELMDDGRTPDSGLIEFLQFYDRGFSNYLGRKWSEACEDFKMALEVRKQDGPSEILLKRCLEFMASPPPDDWDGVKKIMEK